MIMTIRSLSTIKLIGLSETNTIGYYEEQRYADQRPKQEERDRKRAIKALECLGYRVTVDRVASSLSVHPTL